MELGGGGGGEEEPDAGVGAAATTWASEGVAAAAAATTFGAATEAAFAADGDATDGFGVAAVAALEFVVAAAAAATAVALSSALIFCSIPWMTESTSSGFIMACICAIFSGDPIMSVSPGASLLAMPRMSGLESMDASCEGSASILPTAARAAGSDSAARN